MTKIIPIKDLIAGRMLAVPAVKNNHLKAGVR